MTAAARRRSVRTLHDPKGAVVTDTDVSEEALVREMGPIDYVVLEWPGRQPNGEVAPLIFDLADRGVIRILDVAFLAKDEDGSVIGLDLEDIGEQGEFKMFAGAASGILGDDDLEDAARVLKPGT